jgi:SAM-dependent methyltransferase
MTTARMASSDIQRIEQYCALLGEPIAGARSHSRMTPDLIGRLYDGDLPRVEPNEAASAFMNYGYWYPHTTDYAMASENLLEKLVAGMPDRTGRVLDVACGLGATTEYLLRHWSADAVCGINISARQIDACRRRCPQCQFAVMDAAAMTFADGSFQNMLCVEAAFHFDTRQAFLAQASRILAPGGVLALTDVLLHEEGHVLLPMWLRANFVPSLDAYRRLVAEAGFSRVVVIDCTEEGWRSFARHTFTVLHDSWVAGVRDFGDLQHRLRTLYRIAASCRYNVICFATK